MEALYSLLEKVNPDIKFSLIKKVVKFIKPGNMEQMDKKAGMMFEWCDYLRNEGEEEQAIG